MAKQQSGVMLLNEQKRVWTEYKFSGVREICEHKPLLASRCKPKKFSNIPSSNP